MKDHVPHGTTKSIFFFVICEFKQNVALYPPPGIFYDQISLFPWVPKTCLPILKAQLSLFSLKASKNSWSKDTFGTTILFKKSKRFA
eukprot:c26804_g1_i1 orf=33-293(+)